MPTDRYGLALATSSERAAVAYGEGLDLLLAAYPGADARFREAIEHDEGFALAHAGLARHLQIHGRMPQALEAIGRARALVAGASPRERAHVEVLGLLIEGQPGMALEKLLPHLERFPRDALPLSLALGAFGLYGFSGRPDHDAQRLALCRRLAPHYGDDWWFLTHLGWSHTEAGKLAAGERFTRRALELRRENAHGAHAMAHFFAEADEPEDGAAFVEDWLPGYEPEATLYAHLHWHLALWRLQEEDLDGALELYEEALAPKVNAAPPINVISDTASLLWRISLRQPLGERMRDWEDVHAYARTRFPGVAPHFIEWHLAMAAAGAGDTPHLERRLAALRETPAGAVLPAVCAAFRAFSLGNYEEVVRRLEPLTLEFVRLGGSGAQRQVISDTLNAARERLR